MRSPSLIRTARWILFWALLWGRAIPSTRAEVLIPGLANSQLDPELKGWVLIQELGCVACHRTAAPFAARSKKAPRLSEVGTRVNPEYLASFIADPHGIKPGTTMPDVLGQGNAEDRRRVALSLTHFLSSLKTNEFAPQPPDAVAARLGERLFQARGCAACHSPRDANGVELVQKDSVPLGRLEKKYSFRSLVEFLRQPHATRPSGRMPDMRLRGPDVERIAQYLLRDVRVPGPLSYTLYRGRVWEGLAGDEVTAERAGQVRDFALASLGNVEHHTAIQYEGWLKVPAAGHYTFHMVMNGGSLAVDGKQLVSEAPSDLRGVKTLEGSADLAAGWRKIESTYFHTGHEPRFSFEMEGPGFPRQSIPTGMLSVSNETIPAFEPLRVDAELAARGRENFGRLGCANCHDDLRVPPVAAIPFANLNPNRGCMGELAGPWPRFDLSPEQRAWIARALPRVETVRLDDRQQIDTTLATFNCIACHERAGLGGIAPARAAKFTGTREGLGDQGRLPPPLTHVGAKLQPAWIDAVLLHGQRQREYLDASMPQFGDANVGHLVELFGKVDTLETAAIPAVSNAREFKEAGGEMMGADGLACIACHDFNGQKAGGAGALDIVHATERLKKNWFHLYMREPARFHPTVIMPSYWPGGESVRPKILDGDAGRQIEALWTYLEDGTRAKSPVGLSRQARELRVTDVAEICRGRGPAGYRGIAVGYPAGLNLAFDSEQMSLRLLWKGEFANADLGSFEPRGNERIAFPPGIPFHRLESLDAHWPYKGKANHPFPQDHGYQFRGYHLDAQRRPTFLYRYGAIAIEEFFEDVRGTDGKAWFRRAFVFEAPETTGPFYFRAAAGKSVSRVSDSAFSVDRLQLRVASEHPGILREGDPAEVLIPLTLAKGRSTLTLEYQW